MKKLLFLLAALGVLAYLGLLPFHASDVAQLLPVETVFITRSGACCRVDVGAGVSGVGRTLREALDALREQVSGDLFYQTAEQIVVRQDAADALEEIVTEEAFRPSAALYLTAERSLDAKAVSAYLHTRPTALTLGQTAAKLETGQRPRLPVLQKTDGGYRVLD